MKTLMFYELTKDGLLKAKENFEAHLKRLKEFHAKGMLFMAGPYGNPPEGAIGIFTSKEAAEEFIKGDPFVLNGVVGKWRVVDFNEALT